MTHPEQPSRDARHHDSPLSLLGQAMRDACDRPLEPLLRLHALLVDATGYGRLHGAHEADVLAAVDACLALHTAGAPDHARRRAEALVRRGAARAYEAAVLDDTADISA